MEKSALMAGAAAVFGSGRPSFGRTSEVNTASMAVPTNAGVLPDGGKPIKQFWCDLNWSHPADNHAAMIPSLPQDWANVDPVEYFAWHRDFGVNIMSLQAYVLDGYAFYPTKLGPPAPGNGAELFPRLFKIAEKAGMPFCGYFSIAQDLIMSNLRFDWLVPYESQLQLAGDDGARKSMGRSTLREDSRVSEVLPRGMDQF